MALPAILGLGKLALELIDEFIDTPEEKSKAAARLKELQDNGELARMAQRAGIITAEAQSEHFITATWRPITMLVFVAIIANNYILYPYMSLFWAEAPRLELPEHMWELLKIGIGGYICFRGGEKIMREYRK
jgi:hypothetical protein